jgi:beta-xylosidase
MKLTIDTTTKGTLYAKHWHVCVGGGRVGEALRADFQKHLEMIQEEIGFQYIRMHGLFHEDMMVYREDQGHPIFNFQYVDLVFDHWLAHDIRPFVEFGFMPYDLASDTHSVFWWKGNITPPKDWKRWELLIQKFMEHIINRYGIAEIRTWYFEVWNEPNLEEFWKNADFEAYMELYERTVKVIKSIDEDFMVGGPASSGTSRNPGVAPWQKEFFQACADRNLPLDFFSTHPYPSMHPVDLEGKGYMVLDKPERFFSDIKQIAKAVEKSEFPNVERHYTEWNSSPSPRDRFHDTAFMAPCIIYNNWKGRGFFDSLSYWAVSDIFEEGRLGDTCFHGGFGLVNVQGLKKPSYHGYWFLSQLGDEELESGDSYAITRRMDGSLCILLWNYVHYNELGKDSRNTERGDLYSLFQKAQPLQFELEFSKLADRVRIQRTRFDREHGSVYDTWLEMGSPEPPLLEDMEVLRRKQECCMDVKRYGTEQGNLTVSEQVAPHGVTMLEITAE